MVTLTWNVKFNTDASFICWFLQGWVLSGSAKDISLDIVYMLHLTWETRKNTKQYSDTGTVPNREQILKESCLRPYPSEHTQSCLIWEEKCARLAWDCGVTQAEGNKKWWVLNVQVLNKAFLEEPIWVSLYLSIIHSTALGRRMSQSLRGGRTWDLLSIWVAVTRAANLHHSSPFHRGPRSYLGSSPTGTRR